MQTRRDRKKNKNEGRERQVCHRITYKFYDRKEYVHGGQKSHVQTGKN